MAGEKAGKLIRLGDVVERTRLEDFLIPLSCVDRESANAISSTITGTGGHDTIDGSQDDDLIEGLGGNDALRGLAADDTLLGGTGGDTLNGGLGSDVLDGGTGLDWATYVDGASSSGGILVDLRDPSRNTGTAAGDTYTNIENLIGTGRQDTLIGDDNDNFIDGAGFGDKLKGGIGNDTLVGGLGFDELIGGSNRDMFICQYNGTVDTIVDYSVGRDIIGLRSENMSLPHGPLQAEYFVSGEQALDANDKVIYNPATGELFYDPDGNGFTAQSLIAQFQNLPVLSASDFIVL